MKKLLSLMLATLVLLTTSCVKDDLGIKGGEQNVTISVSIPQSAVQSRTAYSNPSLTNDMRVYMYLMYEGKIVSKLAEAETHNFGDNNTLTEEVRIVPGQNYKIAVWADFGDGNNNYYTVTGELNGVPKVTMANTTIPGSNNMYDAYFAIEDLNISENKTVDVTLKRPFGLVKIQTLDYQQPTIVDEYVPAYYSTTITNVPTSLNLLTGDAEDLQTITISSESGNITDFNATGELSFDYFFAGESQKNLDNFTVKYSNSSKNEILSYEYKNIPVRRNYITNVSGNILTKKGDLQITIEQNWEGNILNNVDPAQLQSIIDEAVNSDAKDIVISVSEAIENGDLGTENTLTMPQTDKNFVLEIPNINQAITINEETSSSYTGKLTLKLPEEGTTSASDITINLPNSTVTVENGTYTNVTATTAENTLIIAEGTTVGALTVNGGNVKIYGNVENITKGENATYSKFTWGVKTYDVLKDVLAKTENCDSVVLAADITGMQGDTECIRIVKEGLVFDGNGHTISGTASQNIMVVAANDVEVRNLTITQPETGSASNGLTAYCVTGIEVTGVTIHDCRKAGMIVNGAEVTATGLHTYGNAWGAVNVGKGTGVSETPVFTFDATCNLEESNKVWVDCEDDWTVNAPEGWWSYKAEEVTIFTNEIREPGTVTSLEELKNALPDLAANGGRLVIMGSFEITDLPALEIQKPTILVIKGKITSEDENFYILNKSELTIEATGTVDFNKRVVENHGKLSVTGGTYYSHTRGSGTIFWNNNENAEMVLNNITTYATNFAVAGNGKIEINGGLITSDSSNKYGAWAYCVRAQDYGEMIINDATIQGVQGAIACIESSKITLNNVKAIAKNSEPGRQDAFYALYPASDGVIEVNSGEFYSDRTPCCLSGDDDIDGNPYGAFILKGGKYSSKPKAKDGSDWPAEEGYKFIETSDATYPYEIVKE